MFVVSWLSEHVYVRVRSFMAPQLPLLLAAAGTGGGLAGLGVQVLWELLRASRLESGLSASPSLLRT